MATFQNTDLIPKSESSSSTTNISETANNDLVKAVDQLLDDLGAKFSKVSSEMFERMDEMARRLDEVEAAIQAGNDARVTN